MGALIREASSTLNNESIVFFRNLTGMLILSPWLIRQGKSAISTQVLRFHLLRTASGLTAMYCFFYLISNIPLAEAMLFNYSAPVFMPLIAWLWLKEPLSHARFYSVAVGFIGVLLIIKPGSAIFNPQSLIGLAAGTFAAIAFITVQRLTRSEPTFTIVFYFTAMSTLISSVPFAWNWQALSLSQAATLVGIGTLATLSQFCLTRAYGLAPAAQIGPIQYTAVIFAGFYAWLIWNELPDSLSLAGALLIFIASLMASRSRS